MFVNQTTPFLNTFSDHAPCLSVSRRSQVTKGENPSVMNDSITMQAHTGQRLHWDVLKYCRWERTHLSELFDVLVPQVLLEPTMDPISCLWIPPHSDTHCPTLKSNAPRASMGAFKPRDAYLNNVSDPSG